jgi:hypothetical protein
MEIGKMENVVLNPNFSMQFDTASGRKVYLDIAQGQAQCTMVLTSSPDGVMAIYLCKNVKLARKKIRKRFFLAVCCASWWKTITAACVFRGCKKLSPSG